MNTDKRLAILRRRDCETPRLSTDTQEMDSIPVHGKMGQRFIRREILSMRNDIVRNNMYWRGYEGVRWIVTNVRKRNHAQPGGRRCGTQGPVHALRLSALRNPQHSVVAHAKVEFLVGRTP